MLACWYRRNKAFTSLWMNLSWRWHCPLSGYVSVRGSRLYHVSSVQCRSCPQHTYSTWSTCHETEYEKLSYLVLYIIKWWILHYKNGEWYVSEVRNCNWKSKYEHWQVLCNIPSALEQHCPKNHPVLSLFLHLLTSCEETVELSELT